MCDLTGKHGLIVGVANKRSISWAIAQAAAASGARLALTYPSERLEENVRELAAKLENPLVLPCDVTSDQQIADLAATLDREFGGLDFAVHGAGFAPADALHNPFVETSRESFRIALDVSAYSLVGLTRAVAPLMEKRGGGSILTLTFIGSDRVYPNYNVMGVAKAALESSVRYLASDLGPKNIRVNAISAGAIKTLAASGIAGFSSILQVYRDRAPLRRSVETSEVADAAMFLLSPASRAVTGEILMVDAGMHAIGLSSRSRGYCIVPSDSTVRLVLAQPRRSDVTGVKTCSIRSPLLNPDPLARDAEVLQDRGISSDQRRRPADETERRRVVDQLFERVARQAAARSGPFRFARPGHRLPQLDVAAGGQIAKLALEREFLRRPRTVEADRCRDAGWRARAGASRAAARCRCRPAMKTKRRSSGAAGKVNDPTGPSTSIAAPESSDRCVARRIRRLRRRRAARASDRAAHPRAPTRSSTAFVSRVRASRRARPDPRRSRRCARPDRGARCVPAAWRPARLGWAASGARRDNSAMALRRARGAILRLVRRRAAAMTLGLALVVPAAWVEFSGRYDAWWITGLALIVGATGLAIFWTGLTGPSPDWIE